jgi:hypothetical protein
VGMIASLDPGRKPGYVILDPAQLAPRRFFRGRSLPVVCAAGLCADQWPGVDTIVSEEQWLTSGKNKTAILTLARLQGWQLCVLKYLHPAARVETISVKDWRAAVSGRTLPKETLQARCLGSLSASEASILAACGATPARLGDLYDAVLIGWGWFLAGGTAWKEPP